MSRPRFLADHDFNEHIVDGVVRREPSVEIIRARDIGLDAAADSVLLQAAADQNLLVISHDVNTMPEAAYRRIEQRLGVAGVLMVRQREPIAAAIENLILIWSTSESEEWRNQVWFLPL